LHFGLNAAFAWFYADTLNGHEPQRAAIAATSLLSAKRYFDGGPAVPPVCHGAISQAFWLTAHFVRGCMLSRHGDQLPFLDHRCMVLFCANLYHWALVSGTVQAESGSRGPPGWRRTKTRCCFYR
jgi:hypothetical protein